MGLGDIYEGPMAQRIVEGTGANLQRGFTSIPDLYSQSLRDDYQKQTNVDQQYNSPSREATPHEVELANRIKAMMGDVPPHWEERFKAEHGGGLAAPAAAAPAPQAGGLSAPVPGPQAAPMPAPASQYSGSSMGGGLMGPFRGGRPPPEPAPTGGGIINIGPGNQFGSYTPYGSTMGMSPQPKRGFDSMSMPGKLPPKPQASMTKGDVDRYMHIAPLLQATKPRAADNFHLGEKITLEEAKSKNKGGLQDDAQEHDTEMKMMADRRQWQDIKWRHDDRLSQLENQLTIGQGTAIQVAKIQAQARMYAADVESAAKDLQSIPNLAQNPTVQADAKELQERARRILKQADEMKVVPDTQVSVKNKQKGPQGPTGDGGKPPPPPPKSKLPAGEYKDKNTGQVWVVDANGNKTLKATK